MPQHLHKSLSFLRLYYGLTQLWPLLDAQFLTAHFFGDTQPVAARL